MGTGDEVIQVVITEAMQGPLREWLASRNQYLFPIPVEDDLPTYGIGIAPSVEHGGEDLSAKLASSAEGEQS